MNTRNEQRGRGIFSLARRFVFGERILIVIAIAAQVLVVTTNLGIGNGYNRNWLKIGSFSAQPSEVVKLALVIWLAKILVSKVDNLHDWKHVALPIAPIAGPRIIPGIPKKIPTTIPTAAPRMPQRVAPIFFAPRTPAT